MTLEAVMERMREAGAHAIAVVSRDGSVLASDLPPGVSRETFSIMCATIHGAGMTVSNELKRGTPRRIVLESNEGRVLITEAGRRALIVIVLPGGANFEDSVRQLQPLVDEIAREMG
ncbi:MAG: roadblock/LC7 domain-containing protein [Methanobacteriota archaeon]|nr:MAG: roadblock/LC7 domain-containing protein [Euryarchaeota archaeon]